MIRRDVAQLGSVFVLGTKCRRFKSCHPYLSLLFYGKKGTKDHLISIRREHKIIESYQMRKCFALRVSTKGIFPSSPNIKESALSSVRQNVGLQNLMPQVQILQSVILFLSNPTLKIIDNSFQLERAMESDLPGKVGGQ